MIIYHNIIFIMSQTAPSSILIHQHSRSANGQSPPQKSNHQITTKSPPEVTKYPPNILDSNKDQKDSDKNSFNLLKGRISISVRNNFLKKTYPLATFDGCATGFVPSLGYFVPMCWPDFECPSLDKSAAAWTWDL